MSQTLQPRLEQPSALSPQAASEALFARDFLLLCASTFLFSGSMFLLLVILPLFVVQELQGAESQVGIVAGVFAVAAVLTRPFTGPLVDLWSRKSGLRLGALIFSLAPALYTLAGSVPVMLGLRFFHGTGIATYTTASSVMVADLAPPSRRGEAMGYHGMMLNLAMAIGPALGAALLEPLGFAGLFWLAAAVALASLLLAQLIHESPRPPRSNLAGGERPHGGKHPPLLSRTALLPALVAVCMTMPFAAVLTFLPLFVRAHQLGNPGLFFMVFSLVMMASRLIAGTWSDRFGRAAVILPGMVLLAAAMMTLAYSTSVTGLLSAAVLQGLGYGGVQPALMALAVDRSTEHDRGPALATLMLAFDIGHGLSSMGLGLILEQTNFTVMYLCTGGIALAGAGMFAGAVLLNRTK